MDKNYYGKNRKTRIIPMVFWGLTAYASVLLEAGGDEYEDEVKKTFNSQTPRKDLDKISNKIFGKILSKADVDKCSIQFMKENWPKEYYLNWEQKNKHKYPIECFSDDQNEEEKK